MKRLVPLVVMLAATASIAINCAHDKAQIHTNDDLVCGGNTASLVMRQVKYKRSGGKLTPEQDGSCPLPCPGNSPLVNSFPINGLAIDGSGACSPEGVRVDPGTAGDAKCANGYLQFVEFEHHGNPDETDARLVIKNNAGRTCAGSDLEGTSFTVASRTGHLRLTISKVAQIPYSVSDMRPGSHSHEGYRIVASISGSGSGSGSGDDVSVCDPARSVAVRDALGLPDTTGDYTATVGSGSGSGSGSAESYADYAIAVPGPLYSIHVKPIRVSNFFNLACATDALAKVTLDKVATGSDGDDKHYAALRMLTATYCGKPRTAKNRRFHYENGTGQGSGSGSAEAWWDAAGARCLENLRLEELGDFKDVNLGSDLVPEDCGSNHGHEKCHSWTDYGSAVRRECAGSGDDDSGSPQNSCDESASGMDYKTYLPSGTASPTSSLNSNDKVVRWIKP